MDRTERLLDLVALFLDAKKPVPWEEIRDAFPDEYSGTPETALRKFERDKADLHDLGIPLAWDAHRDENLAGYALDRNAYYLPEVGLTPEELAVLYAAGSATLASGAFPGRQDLAHALRKVGFYAEGPLPAPRVRLDLGDVANASELPGLLDGLWNAINLRKRVGLDYFSPHSRTVSTRQVDPWGLALRRGVWNLVGWCHLRKSVRTFHVHRIRRLELNAQKPRGADFEVPADFRLEDHVASWPWQHRFHDPVEVSITLAGELAPLAEQLFPVKAQLKEGRAELIVSATNLDALVTYVLSLGTQARLTHPTRAVDRAREMAQRVLDAHQGDAS